MMLSTQYLDYPSRPMLNIPNISLFFVGSYSVPGPYFESHGDGLYSLVLDEITGEMNQQSVNPDVPNATYLAKLPGAPKLFAAIDRFFSPGAIIGCGIDTTFGKVTPRSTQSALGTATCHIGINRSATLAAVASYINGKTTIHHLSDSSVSPHKEHFQYQGSGPNTERQECAHAHQATFSPCDRWLYVVDLGSDKIWIHDLQHPAAAPTSADVPAGYGPRHLVCHPTLPLVYLFCELNAKLLTFTQNPQDGSLNIISETPTLPDDFAGSPAGAAIRLHPSLKTLYVSNRNHDSISSFTLDSDGIPCYSGSFFTDGVEPRDFNFSPSGRWLIVANQSSSTLKSFPIDPENGLPLADRPSHSLPCGSPVCILFY